MSVPDLRSERLVLRQITEADYPDALAIYGDERVTRGLGGMEPVPDLDGIRAHFERIRGRVKRYPAGQGGWAVALAGSNKVIGGALLKPLPDNDDRPTEHIEVGWHLAPAYWGQGYATEAARAVLDYGFDGLGLDEIHAVMFPWNTASAAVAIRLGLGARGRTSDFYGEELDWYALARADRAG